jgi:hypothetical protein
MTESFTVIDKSRFVWACTNRVVAKTMAKVEEISFIMRVVNFNAPKYELIIELFS